MEIHRTLGDKVRIYRRVDGGKWHCSTYMKGKEWRKSTKERSLARAKDVAEDWCLELCAKYRFGELRTGMIFAEAAKKFEKHYAPHLKDMAATSGDYSELSEMTGLRTFVTELGGHVAAEAARS